jgi:hypothetical protein
VAGPGAADRGRSMMVQHLSPARSASANWREDARQKQGRFASVVSRPNLFRDRRKAGCQALKLRGCSALEQRAVRSRSACCQTGAAAPWRALAARHDLTPTRFSATKIGGDFSGPIGAGAAVLARTAAEPLENRQPSDIAGFFGRFSRFCGSTSRDACAGARVCRRAYMRARDRRFSEPLNIIYIYHKVRGSGAVLFRFCSRTGGAQAKQFQRVERFSAFFGGWLVAGVAASRAVGRASNVFGGGGGESFGDFRGRAGSGGRSAGRVARGSGGLGGLSRACGLVPALGGRNGGFLRFVAGHPGGVGMVMLEGCFQVPRKAWFSGVCPLPVRLTGGAGAARCAPPWADRSAVAVEPRGGCRSAGRPPVAPIAGAAVPQLYRPGEYRNLDRLCDLSRGRPVAGTRPRGECQHRVGVRGGPSHAASAGGEKVGQALVREVPLRRAVKASGRVSDVNRG